ncbi:c-type cytochrome [bacterium]|nr:c-type cytochrome [bacterium]
MDQGLWRIRFRDARRWQRWLVIGCVILITPLSSLQAAAPHVRLPDGFVISEVSGPNLANDIYAMTLDPKGRIIVSGRGYIRILHDDNQDGVSDRATDFEAGPKFGAMGLLWEDDTLYVTDDGSLMRYHDRDHDDHADGPAEVLFRLNHAGEHGVHGLSRGPDGWLYLVAGDGARANAKTVTTPTSPILDPRGGCVIRLSPDFKRVEIVADGFRNPYDLDFGVGGEFFTYDSDNERCVSLPWYEPTRFYHVVPGGHYGWLSRVPNELWRQPPYFADVVSPVTTLERGSPTGVVCYRHLRFPDKYRGSFFALDWTFGRVWHVPLESSGSTYVSKPELFLEAVGSDGFAPTDAVVDPKSGDLLICIGGRGTKGAVYRIHYAEKAENLSLVDIEKLQPPPRDIDGGNSFSLAVTRGARSTDPLAFRNALESMSRFVDQVDAPILDRLVSAGLDHPDKLIRQASANLEQIRRRAKLPALTEDSLPHSLRSLAHLPATGAGHDFCWKRLREKLGEYRASRDANDQLSYIRAAQLLVGGIGEPELRTTVWDGYSIAKREPFDEALVTTLLETFPSGNSDVDHEISRWAAMIQTRDESFAGRVLDQFSTDSDPIEDIHYLIVLARLKSKALPGESHKVADVLLSLDDKIEQRHRRTDRNFPLRIHELHEGLVRRDASLNDALLESPLFGDSEDLLWTEAEGFDRKRAAERFMAITNRDDKFNWTSDLVELFGVLPEEVAYPLLRSKWDNIGLRDSIVKVLARHPRTEDAPKFIASLTSSEAKTRSVAIATLESLTFASDDKVILLFYKPLALWSRVKEEDAFVERIVHLLGRTRPAEANRSAAEWLAWFAIQDPDMARKLESADGIDVAAWKSRLASLDWSQGLKERGKLFYDKIGCQQCHSGGRAVGPDLAGIGKRFSRDEIFTSILQPSRDVPDRYRMTRISTEEGQLYQGIVVYEAVDGTILQQANLETVRIKPEEVAERSASSLSLMPNSLLESATDQQIVDLYAYLQSL